MGPDHAGDAFLNNVLPYASLDEPRDPWRKELLATAVHPAQVAALENALKTLRNWSV